MQEKPLVFVNIYAPNKTSKRCTFFQEIQTKLDSLNIESDCDIIIGGDFNIILDPEFVALGGQPKLKEPVKIIEQICLSSDLDIWKVRNPNERCFSRQQKNPVIQR